jgi:DNA end-binding protein Ku
VIADALQHESKWALGRVVLSVNRQLVLVRPMGRLLVMDVLHYPSEVRMPGAWEADLRSGAATAEEVRLIRMLLEASSAPLDWRRYRDVTTDELTALIEAKVAGRQVASPEEPAEALHLLDALKQSVAVARKNAEAAKSKQRKPSSRKRAPA